MAKKLQGLIAAPHTPFNANGSVNLEMIPKQIDLLVKQGVIGAYICGTTGLPDAGGTLASDGWYAVGGWRITPKVMAVVRYDTFRENSDLNATRQTDYTGGVLWVPFPRLRCQLNYTRETYAAEEISGRNVMCLMLTGIF